MVIKYILNWSNSEIKLLYSHKETLNMCERERERGRKIETEREGEGEIKRKRTERDRERKRDKKGGRYK